MLNVLFGYCNQSLQQLRGMPKPQSPVSDLSSPQEPGNGLGEAGDPADGGAEPPNHQQWLEHIVRRAAAGEDKVRGLRLTPHFLPVCASDWLAPLVFIYFLVRFPLLE